MPFSNQQRPGLWPTYRCDDAASGHQSLPGMIARPVVQWREFLGGPLFDAHTVVVDGEVHLLLLYGGVLHAIALDGSLRWRSAPLGLEGIIGIDDVDRDGRVEIVASNGKSFFVLSAEEGATLSQEYLGPPLGGGFIFTCALLHHFPKVGPGMQLAIGMLSSREVMLYDFSAGAERPDRRHIFWMDDFFHPTLLAADIDGDGDDELIVTKYSAVYAFDPVLGQLRSTCRWSSGGTPKRNYGLFQVRDIVGRGRPDLLVMSYVVSRHIAVVENEGEGELRNRWDHFIEHVYPHDECELRYTHNSCVDIDGDGRLEIVASVYNDRGDGAWRLLVFDAADGTILSEHEGIYLHDIVPDLRDGGPPLLVVSRESERVPAEVTTVILVELPERSGLLREVGQIADVSVPGRYVRRSSTSTIFKPDIPPSEALWAAQIDGQATLLLRNREDELLFVRRGAESVETLPFPASSGTAAVLHVGDMDGDGRTELVVSDWRGVIRCLRSDGTQLFEHTAGIRYRYGTSLYYSAKPAPTPVVGDRNGTRHLVVPDASYFIHILEWDPAENRPITVRRVPGRGRVGPEESRHSVSIIEWRGETAILMSTIGGEEGEVVALDLFGEKLGGWVVPSLPATPRVAAGRTGVHEYAMVDGDAGPFLFVSGFRSGSMNSELSTVIHAPSLRPLWERKTINEESEDGRGFGPWNGFSLIGPPEQPRMLFLAKDSFCELLVEQGETTRRPWHLRPYNTAALRRRGMTMDDFSAYGTPVPFTLPDGGRAWILLASYGGMGVIEPDHSVRWWRSAPLSSLTGGHGAVADIGGDGVPEVLVGYADGDLVCLRADTGEERWRLHVGEVATDIVSCDIDGDGRIEFLFGTREGSLYAVGASSSGCGLVKWKLGFDYGIGPLAIADVDGDGASEILFVAGDGFLYSVGPDNGDTSK